MHTVIFRSYGVQWRHSAICCHCQSYLTQLCTPASFCVLLKEKLEVFGSELAGSRCLTSGHQQIVLIYVLQKNPPYVRGANGAQTEQWQRLPLAVAQWKEINNLNDSIIIFYPSWANCRAKISQPLPVESTQHVTADWFTSVYMQVLSKRSHFYHIYIQNYNDLLTEERNKQCVRVAQQSPL